VSGVLDHARRFHFVGVGGIGMSGIAELLLSLGYEVSGSDMQRSEITGRLEDLGLTFSEGHDARQVGGADVVVQSAAVKPSNPELVAARERGIPVLQRATLLAELMQLRQSIAVAGAHGKTTTTSMVAIVLDAAGLDPTAVIGGRVAAFGSNARLGAGKYFVAEADESDRSFLNLKPQIAVITNIDREHMEAYRDFDDLQAAFVQFANSVPESGAVVLCSDDPYLRGLIRAIDRRIVTYGFGEEAGIRPVNIQLQGFGSTSTLPGLGALRLSVPGRHNLLNALAAVAVGREIGIDWQDIAKGLESFHGAERRFQLRGTDAGVSVIEDYGHHPTEIAAVVAAAKPMTHGRLMMAFQPHRFSRTQLLLSDFGPSFDGVDVLFLTDIYGAGEDAIPGVNLAALADAIRQTFKGDLRVVGNLPDIPEAIAAVARDGDLVLLQGAGSIGSTWQKVLDSLRKAAGH